MKKVYRDFILYLSWVIVLTQVTMLFPPKPLKAQELPSQFLIFFEKTSRLSQNHILQFDTIELKGDFSSLQPTPLTARLVTDSLKNRQMLFALGTVEPGMYRELRLSYRAESTDSAVAVSPARIDTIPLNANILTGTANVLFLNIHAADSAAAGGLAFVPIPKKIPPLASLALVSNEASDNVLIFDRIGKEVVGALITGRAPRGMVSAPRLGLLFIANAHSDNVSVFNLQNRQLAQIISLDFGDEPEALCLSPDERYLFCANRGSNSATIIDTQTLNPLRKVTTGTAPTDIGVDPWNGWVYVVNQLSDNVTYFPPQYPEQTGTLSVGSSPSAIEFEPRQQRAYLANYFSGEITLINTQNQTITSRYNSTATLVDLYFDSFSNQIYGAVEKQDLIIVFKPSLNLELRQIAVGSAPRKITPDPEGSLLWVTCQEANLIYLINQTAGRVQGVLPAGLKPYQVVFP